MSNQTRRQQIIQALKNKDIEALKTANKGVVYIETFLDWLKFFSSKAHDKNDNREPVWVPGPFKDFITELSIKHKHESE